MLDQNTDRMWYVIGAVIVGAAIIFLANGTLPSMFASVTESMDETLSLHISNPNLLENPTFNNGYEGWRDWVGYQQYSSILEPEPDKPNSHILRVEIPSDRDVWSPMHNDVRLDVKEGDEFTISFDYRKHVERSSTFLTIRSWTGVDDVENGDNARFAFDDTARNRTYINNNEMDGAIGEWKRYSFTGVVTEDSEIALAVYFDGKNTSYDIREIKMEKGSRATPFD